MEEDSYHTVEGSARADFKDRGSRFIGYAYNVESEQQVASIVESLRVEHHASRHVCYAYRLGIKGDVTRVNDDGEPSGSAGRPILGAIMSAGLSCVVVVVVRYFGGVLLGVPGLINAYKSAATAAIAEAGAKEMVVGGDIEVEVGYGELNDVMKIVKRRNLACTPPLYDGSLCGVSITVRLSQLDDVRAELEKIEKIKIYG